MKKAICAMAAALVTLGALPALEVNEPEIRSTGTDAVQFESYGGPHAVIETAAAITNIGTELGRVVAASPEQEQTVQPNGKYTLLHAVDSTEGGLDADILLLNPNAGVDHIRNLRRIITGYLEAAYRYERPDAETIATFVTVYNAVYRGQLPYFAGKYKDVVLQHLTEEKVGLSTNWEEWAGNTQIVIPLSNPQGGISAVDTTVISDELVVEVLRQEEDKGVAVRESLTDIKEREAEGATVRAQEAQRTAAQERAAAAAAPTRAEAAAATARAETAARTAATQQQIADRKTVEVQVDRQNIAADQNLPLPQVDTTNYVTGLFVADEWNGLYRLITVDGATGVTVLRSPVTQIRGKTVYTVSNVYVTQDDGSDVLFPALYLAVCGVQSSRSAVKLCLIDTGTLEIQKESAETLADGTELLQRGDDFYVVVQIDGAYYVGLYDKNLTLRTYSSVPVKAASPLNMTAYGILVTDADGSPRMLNANTLSTIW